MVTLYNPHVDDFLAEPPHFRFLRRRPLKKYGFFIDEALRNGDEVSVLVDATSSAFIPEGIFQSLPAWVRRPVAEVEYRVWKKINKFGPSVRRAQVPTKETDETLFAFSYKAATGKFALRRQTLSRFRAVVFHLSHYFVATRAKSDNMRSLDNVWLAGDSDVSGSAYFRQFFDWYRRPILVLPFAVAPRFRVCEPFNLRSDRCLATGSFHDLSKEHPTNRYQDFILATGSTTYHPIRREIFQNSESLRSDIECRVSPYRSYDAGNWIVRVVSRMQVSQKRYFSINIADLYNKHKFAVVGEELSGFPAIGAFEAMACGCVLFANPEHYDELGLIPNEHFIAYDGSLPDLLTALALARQSDPERIAKSAADFVSANFKASSVYVNWTRHLSDL